MSELSPNPPPLEAAHGSAEMPRQIAGHSGEPVTSPLDRGLPLPGWFGLTAAGILLITFLARFLRLDAYLLNAREANWAYDSWSMFYGRPLPIGQSLPDSSPFLLIWNSVPFYLFGVTDATSRMGSALLGVGIVALTFALRPFLSKPQILAVAGILAISPTMVFASRTVEPGIAAAFFAMLIVVSLLQIGVATDHRAGWATIHGFAIAGLYATGPLGVSTLIALAIGFTVAGLRSQPGKISANAVGTALHALVSDRHALIGTAAGLVIGLMALFSRLFTDIPALVGIGTTLTDWVEMMSGGTSSVPAVFYFWSMMLYETVAVVIAIITVIIARSPGMRRDDSTRQLPVSLFVSWFAASLLLHTTASSRDTGSAVLVVLPVLELAGIGLGSMLQPVISPSSLRGLATAAITIALVAYSINAMIGLAFTRGESGSEPLARDTPSVEARGFIDRSIRLSRDISVNQMTQMDPTGRFGLTINVTPEYEWPFTWYYREFNNFSVIPAAGFTAETDIAIADSPGVMDSVGLTTTSTIWNVKPGDPLTMMRSGQILRTGLNPLNWGDAWSYMINRDTPHQDNPRTITVGYSVHLMNKMMTQTGPFNLFDSSSPGAGSGFGQLDMPAGIATSADGTIYVLNAGNARIDRYSANGTFLGVWNGQVEEPLQLSWNGWQGGTGLQTGPDGLIYIADTWNHAVVIVAPDGTVVRVLGHRGVQTDITDTGSPTDQPGLFFGPRDMAITTDRIYVTDTGNERVQVFGMDGTFITAFGGFGTEEGRLVEPTGIDVAPDGTIWVADSGNARLQQFDADGVFIASHPIPEWEGQLGIERLNMIAISDAGIIYFTVPNQGVWAWQEDERVQVEDTGTISAGGITITADGTLLVTDRNTASVMRITQNVPAEWNVATPVASPAASPVN